MRPAWLSALYAVFALFVLLGLAGCARDSWNSPSPNPTTPPPSSLPAACPLLSADTVGQVFGLTGVQAKEGPKGNIANSSAVTCDYEKKLDFSVNLMVTTGYGQGRANEILTPALVNDPGERISALGDAAAYHVPYPNVGQLIVVKKLGNSQFRMVTLTGGGVDNKEKLITLAQTVLPQV